MINNQPGEAPCWLFIIAYSALRRRIIVKYIILTFRNYFFNAQFRNHYGILKLLLYFSVEKYFRIPEFVRFLRQVKYLFITESWFSHGKNIPSMHEFGLL